MELGELISFYRRRAGLTIDELADKSGVPKSTINKIIGGTTKAPTLENVKSIAKALGVRLADFDSEPELADMFSTTEQDIIKKYRLLSPNWKKAVDGVLDIGYQEYEEQQAARKEQMEQAAADLREVRKQIEAGKLIDFEKIRFSVPGFSMPMSAGTGQEAGQEYPENYKLVKEPPRGTSYIATVSGNSMEPTYHDGDLLFIHACEEIREGQIGVFLMDGRQWVKELGDGELISHNTEYPPIRMRDDIRCQGLVLGVCDKSYFE